MAVEKFPQFLGPTYLFTNQQVDLPKKLVNQIQNSVSLDFQTEKFIACVWQNNPLNLQFQFLLITENRIVAGNATIQQNYFIDVTGIEQNLFKNIVIKSAGNASPLFFPTNVPSKQLREKLMTLLTQLWLKKKSINNGLPNQIIPSSRNEEILVTLEKLNELREKEILTAEEFAIKKKALLDKL
jgi:homoserine trans-succinylase